MSEKRSAETTRKPVSDPHDYDADALPYKIHEDAKTSLPRRRGQSQTTRSERIRDTRMRQPAKELLRKARKAQRQNFWTQEGFDYADSLSREMCRKLTNAT